MHTKSRGLHLILTITDRSPLDIPGSEEQQAIRMTIDSNGKSINQFDLMDDSRQGTIFMFPHAVILRECEAKYIDGEINGPVGILHILMVYGLTQSQDCAD